MPIIVTPGTITFLNAVNRVLQINGLIRGDTDVLTAFTDTTHNATSAIAQIAIQTEIAELISREFLPYNKKSSGSITLATNTRSYDLPADFKSLWGDPFFSYSTNNTHIYEWPGGEENLRNEIYTYKTDIGNPNWFYFDEGSSSIVSFYQVPDSTYNGVIYTFDYVSDTNVLNSGDILPFLTINEYYAFSNAAARRFKLMFEGQTDVNVEKDPSYLQARSTLFNLIRPVKISDSYGVVYV